MDLKKYLIRGQAALEYFILFSVIALLTLLSLSSFFPKVQEAIQGKDGFFQKAVERIIK